jgi:hypothetical protein
MILRSMNRVSIVAVGALLATGCATTGVPRGDGAGTASAPMIEIATDPDEFIANSPGIYVVVDLDDNELSLMDGDETLWSAPVGTGTGLRLEGEDGEWEFTTPQGVFQIQYKEELPVWILPDWYFLEKDLPIPPNGSPERRAPGQLGVAAVYLGQEIAIHGTSRPELLGQRVSHGCIRLENKNALRLFHNVQIGTPVVIRGGEHLAAMPPAESTDPGRPAQAPKPDTLAQYSTDRLLDRMAMLLADGDETGSWVPLASRLITRGLKDDAPALRGVLALAGTAETPSLNREYSTFVADAYSRGTLRAVVSLARIEDEPRGRAARAIVSAMMSLHAGSVEGGPAPWPTRRVPRGRLGPEGQLGWEALLDAEREYRDRGALAAGGD